MFNQFLPSSLGLFVTTEHVFLYIFGYQVFVVVDLRCGTCGRWDTAISDRFLGDGNEHVTFIGLLCNASPQPPS